MSYRPAILILGASAVACSGGAMGTLPEKLPTLDIPAPAARHGQLPPELATLIYPDFDKLARDPFLTLAEEAMRDGKGVLTKAADDGPAVHKRRVLPKIIRQLHAQVHGIILGPPNVFMFQERAYEEGDVVQGTEWVVASVKESGIWLRTKDNQGSDYLPFPTVAAINFDFKEGEAPPKTATEGGPR